MVYNDPFICKVKRAFETKEEALKEMKFLRVDKKYKKLKRAYICDNCGYWHLTKKPYIEKNEREKFQRGNNGK